MNHRHRKVLHALFAHPVSAQHRPQARACRARGAGGGGRPRRARPGPRQAERPEPRLPRHPPQPLQGGGRWSCAASSRAPASTRSATSRCRPCRRAGRSASRFAACPPACAPHPPRRDITDRRAAPWHARHHPPRGHAALAGPALAFAAPARRGRGAGAAAGRWPRPMPTATSTPATSASSWTTSAAATERPAGDPAALQRQPAADAPDQARRADRPGAAGRDPADRLCQRGPVLRRRRDAAARHQLRRGASGCRPAEAPMSRRGFARQGLTLLYMVALAAGGLLHPGAARLVEALRGMRFRTFNTDDPPLRRAGRRDADAGAAGRAGAGLRHRRGERHGHLGRRRRRHLGLGLCAGVHAGRLLHDEERGAGLPPRGGGAARPTSAALRAAAARAETRGYRWPRRRRARPRRGSPSAACRSARRRPSCCAASPR